MTPDQLAAIVARDAAVKWRGAELEGTSAGDRRALLALLRETREDWVDMHEQVCACPFDGSDPGCNLTLPGTTLGGWVAALAALTEP